MFNDSLPHPIFIIENEINGNLAQYWPMKYEIQGQLIDEIAFSRSTNKGRSKIDIMGSVVHEMCHSFIFHHKDHRTTQHNAAWCDTMRQIGLIPKGTINGMNHLIDSRDTLFLSCARELLNDGWQCEF